MTKRGEPFNWLHQNKNYEGEDCLIWPYAVRTDGYGVCWWQNKPHRAHRLMCVIAHGLPLDGMEAAHSCGNGHLGCVNPRHLSWKTHQGNQSDRITHGTSSRGEAHGSAKLTDAQVIGMRAEYQSGSTTYARIAKKHGVTMQVAARAISGKSWKHVDQSAGEAGEGTMPRRRAGDQKEER